MTTAPSPATSEHSPALGARLLVVALGLAFLPAGAQAALWPRSFFDDFPIGRAWIVSSTGPYNEHLVRDVGALFLALAIVSLCAWWRPALCRPTAVAWLVQGCLHLAFHVRHLEEFEGVDRVAMVGSLVVVPIASLAALTLDLRADRRRGHPRPPLEGDATSA